jgi:c-di-GMP-binding flagellar brake protein YcgR
VKEDFTMEVTLPDLSAQDCQAREMDRRMDARKVVSLYTIVADNVGLARGQVTNISRRGCGLCRTKLLRRDQYITLKVYLDDGPAIQIDLGKVRWVEEERAGVEFLSLSEQHSRGLYRLCAEQVELPLRT